jgi:hypothetical protein
LFLVHPIRRPRSSDEKKTNKQEPKKPRRPKTRRKEKKKKKTASPPPSAVANRTYTNDTGNQGRNIRTEQGPVDKLEKKNPPPVSRPSRDAKLATAPEPISFPQSP